MYFVGVDLAWGERKPSGVAVLDDVGRLVHLTTAVSDDDVLAALDPFVAQECVVAFDAPLVVPNLTGNRAAETALNKDFARFDAGAHPVNSSKPELSDGPRAARLAARLGLDTNPRSGRARRALEVYPHPATVALFSLGRTLKYKNKQGRSFALLRSELLELMRLVEGLASATPALEVAGCAGWVQARADVEAAARKSELRVVEDQVDAVICAYVALFADTRPSDIRTYGSWEEGYILTPALPAGLTPSPRERQGSSVVGEYRRRLPQVQRATDGFVRLVTAILDEAGLNYLTITGRAKHPDSFAAKAARTTDGSVVFTDPLTEITDQIGVRVITYVHSDVQAVVDLLADQAVVHDDRDMGRETASEGRFGYASRHLLISVADVPDPQAEREAEVAALRGFRAQVQIRTVLQHAWAEFEHEIRYKGQIPAEHVPEFDRRFTLAAGLLELADQEFAAIRDRLGAAGVAPDPGAQEAGPRAGVHPRELAAFLAGQYADAGWSRTDHYAWVSQLLVELDITSLAQLAEVLRAVDSASVTEQMAYRYPPGAVRRLDDALLWRFGEQYLGLAGNAHRVDALRVRWQKMGEADG